ncbi:hypothetical protein AB0N21_24405 [Streptomyces sp. NPDC051080]|uniref:hypothetical protein n=1 Tax=Streptomyces sp. NPDC051080 TaxID=3157222 RepID=UPI0034373AC4
MRRGEPGYGLRLDRDVDRIGCEWVARSDRPVSVRPEAGASSSRRACPHPYAPVPHPPDGGRRGSHRRRWTAARHASSGAVTAPPAGPPGATGQGSRRKHVLPRARARRARPHPSGDTGPAHSRPVRTPRAPGPAPPWSRPAGSATANCPSRPPPPAAPSAHRRAHGRRRPRRRRTRPAKARPAHRQATERNAPPGDRRSADTAGSTLDLITSA